VRNVVITDTAESEFRLINEYLSFFGPGTADAFVNALAGKIDALKEGVVEFPISRDPDLAQAGFHAALVNSYIMLYRIAENGDVHIAHVFHQTQDYAKLVIEAERQ